MERLEAAIIKARQQQATSSESRATAISTGEPSGHWDSLPHVTLDPKVLTSNRIVTFEASPEATAFDILRTRTLRVMHENGWRRLAITSPTPGCGKTTTTLNLAFSMARQARRRTIAVEMDMRRPNQENLLGLSKDVIQAGTSSDVSRLITGDVEFNSVCRRPRPELAIVTSNSTVHNASDILLDTRVGEALRSIEEQYAPDLILFDMPPVLKSDDTLAFMQHVDCALIVAAAEYSTVEEIDRCERELASQTNVLGVTLNKCRLGASETEAYGYY